MPVSKRPLKHPQVSVVNDTDDPLEVIVSSLHKVATGIDKINKSGLRRRTVVLLLHDATGVGKRDIEHILDAAPLLVDRYTNSRPA